MLPESEIKRREYHRRWMASYRQKNPDANRLILKRSYRKHAERRRIGARVYRLKIKSDLENAKSQREKSRVRRLRRYREDLGYRLRRRISGRVRMAVSKCYRSGSAIGLLGCSVEELRNHLESLFLPGMSWKNYGQFGWHIDHVRPVCTFDLTNPEQQKQCFHYTNLQPLWWSDNLSKRFTK